MGQSKSPWPEDPWEWTIDQVVTALCDQTFPFRATKNPQPLPDATLLEQKLREHYIEGCSLLTDINHASLKEDFNIRALGQRGTYSVKSSICGENRVDIESIFKIGFQNLRQAVVP